MSFGSGVSVQSPKQLENALAATGAGQGAALIGLTDYATLKDRAAQTLHASDYDIAADGTTDDEAGLRALIADINALTGGGVVELPKNGVIYVDNYITAGNGVQLLRIEYIDNLVIRGNGCTIKFKGDFARTEITDRSLFLQFLECDNLYIENLSSQGNVSMMTKAGGLGEPTAHGLMFAGCKGVTAVNCHSVGHPGDGWNYGRSGTKTCERVLTINCTGQNNARNNLSLIDINGYVSINDDYSGAGVNMGTYSSGHPPQAGVDVEPLVSGASVDKETGDILFIRPTLANNVGSAITATDNGHLKGKVRLVDPIISNEQAYSYPLYLGGPLTIIDGGDIDCGSGYARLTEGYTQLRGIDRFVGEGLVLTAEGAATDFEIDGCNFECEAASALSSYFINLDGGASAEKRIFKSNRVTVPDAAHDGTSGGDAACRFKDTECEGNKYFTDLTVSTTEHFYNEYTGSSINAQTRDEDYRAIASDAYRPAIGSSWNLANLFGRGQRASEQLVLAAGNNSRSTMILSGNGAPSGDPGADRALYIRYDGSGSNNLYFWNGSAWAAIA